MKTQKYLNYLVSHPIEKNDMIRHNLQMMNLILTVNLSRFVNLHSQIGIFFRNFKNSNNKIFNKKHHAHVQRFYLLMMSLSIRLL